MKSSLPPALADATLALHDAAQRARSLAGRERPDAARTRLARAVAGVLAVARDLEETDPPPRVRKWQLGFRREAREVLSESWIMHRSISKPRGLAGDHLLLDALYTSRTSPSVVGRLLDALVLDSAAGRAVIDRRRYVSGWITERLAARPEGARIADIACGPCRLERDVLEGPMGERARFLAMDGDEQALAHAQRVVSGDPRVQLWHENAIRVARDPYAAAPLQGVDLIVSLGLFDYLPDRIAVRLLRALAGALRPGGELLVGNFADDNPSRVFMEWFGDWTLIHRSEEQFLSLFEQAGLERAGLTARREAAGGSVLLVHGRTGPARPRAVSGPPLAAVSG